MSCCARQFLVRQCFMKRRQPVLTVRYSTSNCTHNIRWAAAAIKLQGTNQEIMQGPACKLQNDHTFNLVQGPSQGGVCGMCRKERPYTPGHSERAGSCCAAHLLPAHLKHSQHSYTCTAESAANVCFNAKQRSGDACICMRPPGNASVGADGVQDHQGNYCIQTKLYL